MQANSADKCKHSRHHRRSAEGKTQWIQKTNEGEQICKYSTLKYEADHKRASIGRNTVTNVWKD